MTTGRIIVGAVTLMGALQVFSSPVEAQSSVRARFMNKKMREALDDSDKSTWSGVGRKEPRPGWRSQAQLLPAPAEPSGTPSTDVAPAAQTPTEPSTQGPATTPGGGGGRREMTIDVDTKFGFDKQSVVQDLPLPTAVDVRRRIRTVSVSVGYPLSRTTNINLNVPYVYQSARLTSAGGSFKATGQGIGDISLFLQKQFPEIAKGTELAVALGMVFPTGKDPFEINFDQLPTGVGFHQPMVRVTLRKLRVPLQLYAAVDYGTSLSRNVNGQRISLPDSYGGELGFFYALGPEFTAQTAVSWSKVSSPFIIDPSATVGYLTQSLTYKAGDKTSVRGSVDVGLTDDSTDVYLGLSMNSTF